MIGKDQDDAVQGEVRINQDGTIYAASFLSAGGVLTVISAFGHKSVPLNGHHPEDAAKAVLRELLALETRQMD